MDKLILFIFISLNVHSLVLKKDDLIVVHPSKYYHSDEQTIKETNTLTKNSTRSILTYQLVPSEDKRWYINVDSHNQILLFSRAGEIDVSFDQTPEDISISLAGGYLTSCLGRTASHIVAAFFEQSKKLKLNLYLHSKSIFTGHLLIGQELNPKTALEESILDDTIDGLNLFEVLRNANMKAYLKEIAKTGILNKSPLVNLDIKVIFFKNGFFMKHGKKKVFVRVI